MLPSLESVGDRIVRVNTGNDSNVQRELVIESTKHYRHKFFNTSIPNFDFPAPVVFTCNRNAEQPYLVQCPPNVMFVRVRVNLWDFEQQDKAIKHYIKHSVPVVLTFMRYYDKLNVNEAYTSKYTWKKHITNSYWCLENTEQIAVWERYKGLGVRMCGLPWSSRCIDCRNCELLYYTCLTRTSNF